MSERLFPGLRADHLPLYKVLQMFIAQNGGRNKLADILEAEMVKKGRYVQTRLSKIEHHHKYNPAETKILLDNYGKISARKIAEKLKRSNESVYHKIHLLRADGIIKDKPKYHWKSL